MCALRILQKQELLQMPRKVVNPTQSSVRYFWEYVNMMFNKPDPERIKMVGPDRACAEWVLRNGGKVVWEGGKKQTDYNLLPSEKIEVPKLIEIDGTESSISHYGFSHLSGCTKLQKIILHENKYIEDRAMKGLAYGKETLLHVQVSKCLNVTDIGLKEIKALNNLKTLLVFGLSGVNDINGCKQYLQQQLPDCKIADEAEQLKS